MHVQKIVLAVSLLAPGTLTFAQDPSLSHDTPQHQAMAHYQRGQDLLRHEHREEAVEEFRAAIELQPLMLFAYLALGRAQMSLKQYDEAVSSFKACDQAYRHLAAFSVSGAADPDGTLRDGMFDLERTEFKLEAASKGSLSPEAQNQMSRMQNTMDDLKKLKEGLAGAPIPSSAECKLSEGSSLVHLGRLKEAERAFGAAIQGRAKFGEAHNNLAVVYKMEGRDADALREVKLAEKYKFKVRPEFKRALSSPDSKAAAAAAVAGEAEQPAALHDDTPRLSYPELAALYQKDAAGALFELASTPIADVQYRLERLRTPAGRKETGDRALALGALLHTELAFKQAEKGAAELAHFHLGIAHELVEIVADQEVAETIVRPWFLVVARQHQSELDGQSADRLLRDGLGRFPDDPEILLAMAASHEAMLFRSDDPEAGLKDLEKDYRHVLERSPGSAEAHLRLGYVLLQEGRLAEAAGPLEWAQGHGRGREPYLAELFLGGLEERRGHPGLAADAYRKALGHDPAGQSAVLGLSHSLGLTGEGPAGLRVLEESFGASKNRPPHVDPWWVYRMGLLVNGDETWAALRALLGSS